MIDLEYKAKEAVDKAKSTNSSIIMNIVGYHTDQDSLYLKGLLRYAYDNGVEVIFAPKEDA